ncbi:hypothetical protein BDW59DRAFT_137774 [Aspergillus cavernicola]|uniref:Uncharacterized protein n=1 Tax=Aspergillus cavernicola TaxID=176166 RepID=A0ABR4J394_9EURO
MSVNAMPSTPLAGRINDPALLEVLESWHQTPKETIEELVPACITNNLPRFRTTFDKCASYGYDIHELADVMCEAVYRNNVEIVLVFPSNGQECTVRV